MLYDEAPPLTDSDYAASVRQQAPFSRLRHSDRLNLVHTLFLLVPTFAAFVAPTLSRMISVARMYFDLSWCYLRAITQKREQHPDAMTALRPLFPPRTLVPFDESRSEEVTGFARNHTARMPLWAGISDLRAYLRFFEPPLSYLRFSEAP
jgi:hypothetical protein